MIVELVQVRAPLVPQIFFFGLCRRVISFFWLSEHSRSEVSLTGLSVTYICLPASVLSFLFSFVDDVGSKPAPRLGGYYAPFFQLLPYSSSLRGLRLLGHLGSLRFGTALPVFSLDSFPLELTEYPFSCFLCATLDMVRTFGFFLVDHTYECSA